MVKDAVSPMSSRVAKEKFVARFPTELATHIEELGRRGHDPALQRSR